VGILRGNAGIWRFLGDFSCFWGVLVVFCGLLCVFCGISRRLGLV